MSSFVTILFTGVLWLSNGDMEPVITRPAANMGECRAMGMLFEQDIAEANNGVAGPMRATWHWDCRTILNDSASKSS